MRIFSGIQPTGELHIGNYLGAIKQWLNLQEKQDCFFCIVDLHALTVPQDPKTFRRTVLEKAMEYYAVGLDPEKCIIFVQSTVKEHSELAWILNTVTPIGELERMIQYKDKAKKNRTHVNVGLFDYPVLMAADILLYKTDAVPVGQDQAQHLELTRFVAKRFNNKYGEVFVEPETILSKEAAKIMSLKNPKRKMSKTDGEDSYISLFESPDSIEKKIAKAVTDPGKEVTYSPNKKPGISNLLTIYAQFSGKTIKEVEREFKGEGYAPFKKALTNLLAEELDPFRKKNQELLSREVYVQELLSKGAEKARAIAAATMEEVREKVGLLD
ncbi:tryptophan--tRNA ligase [Patescibacteria group bacterium]|nr:tryptophan--tRNA ligase [Patescibacteria group bacterium]